MNIPLMSDERIIKSWDYAKQKGLIFTKGQNNLTVTNKRIIAVEETKHSYIKEDIPIENIREISAKYYDNFSIPRIIFGIILCLGLITLPFGILLLLSTRGALIEVCVGNTASEPIIQSCSSGHIREPDFKIKVDKHLAKEICKELSSIIFVDAKKLST